MIEVMGMDPYSMGLIDVEIGLSVAREVSAKEEELETQILLGAK